MLNLQFIPDIMDVEARKKWSGHGDNMEGKRKPNDYKLFCLKETDLEGVAMDWLSMSCSLRRV